MKRVLPLLLYFFSIIFLNAQTPQAPSGYQWEKVEELTDEFNGNTLDPNKWDDYHPHWSGRAPSNFKKGNAYVADGNLCLKSTMRKHPSTVSDPFKDIWVDAAACVSKGWTAKPGYFYEARFKASNLSMTSSFWFRVGDYSEIDVIEHIGNPSRDNRDDDLPYQYHANTHYYGKYAGLQPLAAEWHMPTRGRDEYHVYGFWWKDPNTLWFYHNGVKVMEIIPRRPLEENLKMIFDTEVFPFASAGVAHIGLPLPENLQDDTKNTMYVDYVRTYKLVEGNVPTQDEVSFYNVPASMTSSNQLAFDVAYSCPTSRDLFVALYNPEGKWLGNAKKTVSAVNGTATLTIDLGTYTPTPRTNHEIRCHLREVGGDLSTLKVEKKQKIQFTPNDSYSGAPVPPTGKKWEVIPLLTDDFNGSSLDNTKWQPTHPYWDGRDPSVYNTSNVFVGDGMLQLLSSVKNADKTGNWVHAACVTSQTRAATAGVGTYYEASIRGSDISMTSAFWLQGKTTEIDVTENFGHTTKTGDYYVKQRSQMLSNTHSFSGGWNNDIITPKHADMPTESDHRFYTYGVWWKNKDTVQMYLNGVLVNTLLPGEDFDEDQYMFFDTETFEWQGLPTIEELRDPDRNMMYVNWVRSYKLVDDNNPKLYFTVPGIVEAEDFDQQSGIQSENTQDVGGGKNIGYIENGDWAEYLIEVTEGGDFDLVVRAASNTSGGTIKVLVDNQTLTTVPISSTGGWQSWEDFTAALNLTSGKHTLKLLFEGSAGYLFNLNKYEINKPVITGISGISKASNYIYPNPADGILNFSNAEKWEIKNTYGYTLISGNENTVNISALPGGLYLVQQGDKVFKLIKK